MSENQLILEELKKMREYMQVFVPDLTIEKEVINFLGKDKRTFKKYLDEGRLAHGIHYVNTNERKVYIPEKIIEFKKCGCSRQDDKAQQVLGRILN